MLTLPPALLDFFFHFRNVPPSTYALLFYVSVPCLPQIKPGVHTIALVFPRFFFNTTLSNILTTSSNFVWAQMGL